MDSWAPETRSAESDRVQVSASGLHPDMQVRGLKEQRRKNGSHPSTAASWELKAKEARRGDCELPGPIPVSGTCSRHPGSHVTRQRLSGRTQKSGV